MLRLETNRSWNNPAAPLDTGQRDSANRYSIWNLTCLFIFFNPAISPCKSL